jgi:hypothetical protein
MDDLPVKLEGKMSIFSVFSAVVTTVLIFCNAVSTAEVVCVSEEVCQDGCGVTGFAVWQHLC